VRDTATILHADLDAFYASVEVRDDPTLRGKPVAVGGGVVLAATYEARRFGVAAPLGGVEARRRCPRLIIVPPRFEAYVEASRTVMGILEAFTPAVEPISIDEAFLDVAGSVALFGPAEEIARSIRARIRAEVGLPISIGAATTKHLAKIASRVAKPDGLVVVPAGAEDDFLDPLPVAMVWGIGPVGEKRLAHYGIRTIGELRGLPEATMAAWFGPHWGAHLWHRAHNHDIRSVQPRRRAGSVGAQSAGRADDVGRRHAILLALADRVGTRMRSKAIAGRRVTVRVRLDDMTELTRAQMLPGPIAETTPIFRAATALVEALIADRAATRGITLVGISVSKLEHAPHLQLALPLTAGEHAAGTPDHLRHRDLDAAVDRARSRFGRPAVVRATLLESTPEQRSPMIEAVGE
jgi:DNA polymerase IV